MFTIIRPISTCSGVTQSIRYLCKTECCVQISCNSLTFNLQREKRNITIAVSGTPRKERADQREYVVRMRGTSTDSGQGCKEALATTTLNF
jgi:hypothetical protein